VAVLGAIALIAITSLSLEEAARAVDLPTIVLLFAFMVVSAQMRLRGSYTADRCWRRPRTEPLLGVVPTQNLSQLNNLLCCFVVQQRTRSDHHGHDWQDPPIA
jgi:hypothetical protein